MADTERGIGGGALGFSKLSSRLRGKRGLAGGLIIGGIAAYVGLRTFCCVE